MAPPLRHHFATQERLREQSRSPPLPQMMEFAETFSVSGAPRSFLRRRHRHCLFFLSRLLNIKGFNVEEKTQKKKEKSRRKVSTGMFRILFAEVLNGRVAKGLRPTPDPLAKPTFTRKLLSGWMLFHIVLFLAPTACAAFSTPRSPNPYCSFPGRDERRERARGLVVFQIKSTSLCSNLGYRNEREDVKVSFRARE